MKTKEEVEGFLDENKAEIFEMAVGATSAIHNAIVWLNIDTLELSVGSYTSGMSENPKNVEREIVIFELLRAWDDFDDIDLCHRWENGKKYRTFSHYEYTEENENIPLTFEEIAVDKFDVGYSYFCERDEIDGIWEENYNKFVLEEKEKSKKCYTK